jgi:hypothetical protein
MKPLISKLILALSLILFLTSCNDNKENNNNSIKIPVITCKGNLSMCDGYIPPSMPNERENNKDLLGVDSNNNGVRDDIEIYIYDRFKDTKNYKVDREIAMQFARMSKELIQNPETAYEDGKYVIEDRALACQFYYYEIYLAANNLENFDAYLKFSKQNDMLDAAMKDVIYNTKDRLMAYIKYNESMSGHVFDDRPYSKDNCDFDIDNLIVY